MSADLWQQGCALLAAELPEQQFNTWIRPLTLAEETTAGPAEAGPVVVVRVANRFKLDWIRAQYAHRLDEVLTRAAGRPMRVELTVAPRAEAALQMNPAAHSTRAPSARGRGADTALSQPAAPLALAALADTGGSGRDAAAAPARPTAAGVHRLNPLLTFDSLVAGRANQMARTAALHVAGAPGETYNPLFIYGGVGLGKTHLVHAVGNALLKDRPDARVLYLHAEQFISDVVRNYQRKTFDELKSKYHNLDLLLIDDVQFFAGKERTQEEFFNTFEALLAKRAHIIMTSDTYPKGLVDIDERLTSRFDAGLTVAIEPPELEMRVAILIAKAKAEAADMPEDVAFFIAKNVRANVRELEGALRKVLAYSRFTHKDIGIAMAKEALKDLLSIQNRQISVENIQKTVADYYKIKVADMYSKKRPASIARPRQIAMYLAKDLTKKSLPEIGELFGGRDHTTVLHAVRKIGDERRNNPELNQQLHVLEQSLKG
jgi:chromosomal replication initiator protein